MGTTRAPGATSNGGVCVAGTDASRYRASTTLRRTATSWSAPVLQVSHLLTVSPSPRYSCPVRMRTCPVRVSRAAARAK